MQQIIQYDFQIENLLWHRSATIQVLATASNASLFE